MRRYLGWAVVLFGIIHIVDTIASNRRPLAAIVRGGLVNAVKPHPDREAAFWSFWLGVVVAALGAMIASFQARHQPVPPVAGWTLLAMGVCGGILMPLSGFWAGIPLGLLLLLPPRRAVRHAGT